MRLSTLFLHLTSALLAVALVLIVTPSPAQIGSGGVSSGSVDRLPEPIVPQPRGPFGAAGRPQRGLADQAIITALQAFTTERDGTVAYSSSRTKIAYNEFEIEADRMVIDFVTEDIQAEGNVIFQGDQQFIRAERGRFNLGRREGVAYGVNGQADDVYFAVYWDETEKGPSFRQISDMESVYRGVNFTTNPFPVPMYYVKTREAILVRGERLFMRDPIIYVRGVPVFYVPFYTVNLKTGSPWSNTFGYSSRLGGFFRLGYRYIHRVQMPTFADPTVYETRTHGVADFNADIMTLRGEGAGVTYRYNYDYGRHLGYMMIYGLRDRERDVVGENEDGTTNRWVYRHKHNTEFNPGLYFQYDADLASDPDVYVDVLDRFSTDLTQERGRLFEQHLRTAVTFRSDRAISRLAFDRRERLGRDRYTDFAEPGSDDLDFDPDPEDERERRDLEGIDKDRFGVTTERFTGRYSTRLLNLGGSPLYYRFEANAFRALDAGFNQLNDEDDEYVDGVDIYGSITHRLRIGRRTTWTNTIGVGAAAYDRSSDNLVAADRFDAAFADQQRRIRGELTQEEIDRGDTPPVDDGLTPIDSLRFRDRQTVVFGGSPRENAIKDSETYYLFADYTSRLNHRFTDFLDGYIEYKIREGTDDSLGEFYERVGRVEARTDIYDFYTNRHMLTGGLNFYLRYPNLTASIFAGENLQSDEDIYPNEQTRFAGVVVGYRNPLNTLSLDVGTFYDERQIRDQEDPNSFNQASLYPFARLSYFPRHARYWASLDVRSLIRIDEDPVERTAREEAAFDENRDEVIVTPLFGRRFGPKYRLQVSGTYNSKYENWQRAAITLIRDLHDAELGLSLGVRNNSFEARRRGREDEEFDRTAEDYEFEIRASIQFKISRDQPGLGNRSITTLADLRREGYYVR